MIGQYKGSSKNCAVEIKALKIKNLEARSLENKHLQGVV